MVNQKGYYTLRAFKFGHFNFLQQALANALRYFPTECHEELAEEFAKELEDYGHIYDLHAHMYRFLPEHDLRYELLM